MSLNRIRKTRLRDHPGRAWGFRLHAELPGLGNRFVARALSLSPFSPVWVRTSGRTALFWANHLKLYPHSRSPEVGLGFPPLPVCSGTSPPPPPPPQKKRGGGLYLYILCVIVEVMMQDCGARTFSSPHAHEVESAALP